VVSAGRLDQSAGLAPRLGGGELGEGWLRRAEGWVAGLLLCLGAVLRLWGVDRVPTTEASWREVDGFAMARHFFEGDGSLLSPWTNWSGSQPVASELALLPWVTGHLYHLVGEHFWVGRSLVAVMAVASLWALWRLGGRLGGAWVGLGALGVAALHPLAAYYGGTMMPDSVAFGLALLGLLWLDDALWTGRRRAWALAALAVSLALVLKPPVLFWAPVFGVLVVVRRGWRGLGGWGPCAVLVAAALSLLGLLANARALYLDTGNTFGILYGHNKFQPALVWTAQWWEVMSPRLLSQVAPKGLLVLVVLGVIGMWWRWLARERVPDAEPMSLSGRKGVLVISTWAASSLGYFLLVAEGNKDMPHYQLPLVAPLALLVGGGLAWVFRDVEEPRLRLPLRALAVVALMLGVGAGLVRWRGSYEGGLHEWEDGQRIRAELPQLGRALLVGGHTHHLGGPDYDPRPFFYTGLEGWALTDAGYNLQGLASYCALGARYILLKRSDPHFGDSPISPHHKASGELRELLAHQSPLHRTESYLLFQMPPCDQLPPPPSTWPEPPGSCARPVEGGFRLTD
jgi:hypothetical protein